MDIGAAIELILGQETVTVTISGLFDASKTVNGHGTLAMDSVALFAPEELFREIHPEIESFDYSWSIVNDPVKAESVESRLKELISGRSNLGMDTKTAHIEYEKMQSSIIFGSGAVPPCAVWYGGSPVSLDGAQAEKAIPGSADAGTKLNSTW